MTVFVTGGSSSIGRVLLHELSNSRVPVRVLVRPTSDLRRIDRLPGVTFWQGDVADPESIRKGMAGCDRVVHMAAVVGHQVPEETWWRVNRDGTRNVLQAAQALEVQSVVQVSTLAVLGSTHPGELADEHHLPDPVTYTTLYQKTKRAADDIAREYAAQGLPVTIVYPGFGYGCSWASSHTSFQEQTLLRMAANKPVMIFGDGTNRICLSYYKDTVDGIMRAFERGRVGQDYILGGSNLTFPEIWAAIADVLSKSPPRRHVSLTVLRFIAWLSKLGTGNPIFPDDFLDMIGRNWCYSSAKAQSELGWSPHGFREALAETWEEYQQLGWQP